MGNFSFLYQNFFKPELTVSIQLGTDTLAQRYLNSFRKRHWKRAFLPHKKYNCSIIDLSTWENFESYLATVKGKNSADYYRRRALKLNYTVAAFNPNEHIEAIYRINTSSEERQGRKMDASYLQKIENWPSDEQNIWIGVFNDSHELVSYVWLIFFDEMALMNRIFGDVNHLKNNVMYLNVLGAIEYIYTDKKVPYLMYDTFGRKKNGLVLFKKRIGFKVTTTNFK